MYLCTRFQNERAQEKRLKFFLKKIWSIEKKVVPLHPQKWRVKKMRPRKIFEKRFGQLKKKVVPLHPQTKRLSSLRNIDNTAQKDLD